MSANGPRCVQLTAAMLGAQNAFLGDQCVWWLKPQEWTSSHGKRADPGSQSETYLPGLWMGWIVGLSLRWETWQETGLGHGEARNLEDVLREMSRGQLDTDTGVGYIGGLPGGS